MFSGGVRMLFKLNLNLTEDDYLNFNTFHTFESAYGKKTVIKTRIMFILIMALLEVYIIFAFGPTPLGIGYAALLLAFVVLYMVFFKKIVTRNINAQIKRLKKIGKLPFDPVSTLEFYEDKLVEVTPSSRTEQGYGVLERICVVKDRYILLYKSSVNAYKLPVAQIKEQLDQESFIAFLSGKCANVEYY